MEHVKLHGYTVIAEEKEKSRWPTESLYVGVYILFGLVWIDHFFSYFWWYQKRSYVEGGVYCHLSSNLDFKHYLCFVSVWHCQEPPQNVITNMKMHISKGTKIIVYFKRQCDRIRLNSENTFRGWGILSNIHSWFKI